MFKNYWKKGAKQKTVLIILALIIAFTLFVLRDDYQFILLFIRKYIFILLIVFLLLFWMLRAFRKADNVAKKFLSLGVIALFFAILYFVGARLGMYSYMQKYAIFKNLNLIEINELPLTKNDRIQPLNNIFTMAKESIGETLDVSLPHLVRVGQDNHWTMAVEPSREYTWQRISDNIKEIFSVSSTSAFPRFANENRIPVTFAIGETLKFSRNSRNAVIQRLNPLQYFTTEPSDVFYMKNDQGKWVEVVSLIKWKGFFFPYPSFGGVVVIESGEHDFNDYLERLLIGKGTYISPSNMKNYPFLQRQNILSEKVSRLEAESMMFLNGFTDPLPWKRETAVKIPDLKDDENQQPFVTDFDFSGIDESVSGLHHWFGLEPIGTQRTSLTFSVFIPADGTQKVLYYNHAKRKEGMAGVSAMPLKVMESKKEYDWSVNKPVEFRPYIKKIAGRKRMFMLCTITSKHADDSKFDGSATPDLALVDAEYRDVIWIDAKHPSQWERSIYKQLNEVWKASENIGDYFTEDETTVVPVVDTKDMSDTYKALDSLKKIVEQDKKQKEIKALQRKLDSLKKLE